MRDSNEVDLYGDIVYSHKLSIRSIVREYLLRKFAKRFRTRELPYYDNAIFPSAIEKNKFIYLAVIQDGVVVEMLRLRRPVGEMIKKSKTKFVEYDPSTTVVKKEMIFQNKKFIDKYLQKDEEAN
jgi:hypothetical protein